MFNGVFKKRTLPTRELPDAEVRKPYSPPEVRKLNSEQAILVLLGRAWSGDEPARDLLSLLFPVHGEGQSASSPMRKSPEAEILWRADQVRKVP